MLFAFALATYQKIKKARTPEEAIYEADDTGNKIINYTLRKYEDNQKQEIIINEVKANRNKNIWFYVASKHGDCATDHIPYQGKLYVDAAYPKELAEFVSNNNIMTIQQVMDRPIWFITRPYCRHYFQAKSTDRVLQGKWKAPYRKVGNMDFQTKPKANVEYYRNRLNILKQLKPKTAKIRDMELKTKMLIKKWESYYLI